MSMMKFTGFADALAQNEKATASGSGKMQPSLLAMLHAACTGIRALRRFAMSRNTASVTSAKSMHFATYFVCKRT